MKTTIVPMRRGLAGVFAVTALGGVLVTSFGAPSAEAGQDPCAASQVAKTIGMVATSTGTYLDAHPTANQTLTTISQQQAGPQSLLALKTYFDANPQEGAALQNLQAPLVTLSSQCKLPLTLPQMMGLMQSAQQGGGLPATLPTMPSVPGAPSAPGSAPFTPSLPGVTTATGSVPPAQAVSAH
ncbi:hemophore [Mycobacterium sp. CBMA293]|uniref:hemophore n=1 Tax=unclassified Mycolicibacterium TaxID=2636767 RepID=UPI0012DFD467|nr:MULTISPECIES: hemophore [unclassified Mycolicibacterium]MUL47441.1 hemophore [Mycolicibacterium sp. CBMA 360]MUL59427.1 hemophore [Mycolicibacterium sp. CBMA 335]MUL71152.1 hemophore [Mycolicibacterium sp. CBMA 311]MUL94795.1 hemophore [Mycolicibacterium sp. CBMA 230]MUM03636.1 hemophore [Mycolicibacterium sp. CBMA 213]